MIQWLEFISYNIGSTILDFVAGASMGIRLSIL